ncbi:hypothetical protein A3A49_01530 [Candidatus Curtissbacteria bacterium RIFCSPLOWO2_01_FULL_38_11b]|uniref:Uncharacterized protein n=1 Tax=Candidatus Curtissbacteria bacterium RIFCSPLOWO2_01_FULL_38_11b TaxID=1797725 RepID=A0A1F5H0X3_9BACT|nr:MAG: hypothetical protein A3A49_01530 [Candidatus Curtissbacteria bacterium RIFCSPLOWO2_01_FULL_38_11b]
MKDTPRIQKLITFSPQLYQVVLAKAKQLGLSFGEYMRHLAIIDVKKEVEHLPMVDEATDKRIGQSLKDLAEGRYTEVDPSNEKALNKALGIK